MIRKIRKRDGKIDDFNPIKITNAIWKAAQAVGGKDYKKSVELTDKVIQQLEKELKKGEIPTVEQVQDVVEKILIEEGHAKTAKAYILYRKQHQDIREIGGLLKDIDVVDGYLSMMDWKVQENSNMSYSLQGLNVYATENIISHYWLNKIYPPEIGDAHTSGDFHIHDLGTLGPYCVGWDLKDLLLLGFKGVSGKIESKPAKHFSTALMQIVNYLYTLQGEAAGAQALSNFDSLLAPFVRYDGLKYNEVKQEMQKFLFNMNVPTRVGFQSPFTNITLDLTVPNYMMDEPAIVGGDLKDDNYSDFVDEMDMINHAFAEIMYEGDAKGRPFTFPIPTYNITKDFDWKNEGLDPIWKMTAKYGTPYFSNFINSDMKPDDARSMCLHPDEEVLIKNTGNIKRIKIKELAERYKKTDYDAEGWAECDETKNLQIMSLNPETLKIEWAPVKRFLKIVDKKLVEIKTEDGKFAKFSTGHIIPILTENGIENKRAEELKEGDYLINLKSSKDSLSKKYQKIGDLILNEDLAKILGYFIADGNYLFESRKNLKTYGKPRGLQFTFKYGESENIDLIKSLLKNVFNCKLSEKKDPRYNTYYLYVYSTELARKLYNAGFKKYGCLPQILFNSPGSVIKCFLEYHFKGDGYEKRKEIHLNDLELSRDLVLLYSLIGQPVIYRLRKNSQIIYLQHAKSPIKSNGLTNNPLLHERIPGFLAKSTYMVPGLVKSRTVGLPTLEKYNAKTTLSELIEKADIYIVRIKSILKKTMKKAQEFYDVELSKNHLFVHSLGMITHNCCRLRLDNRELRKRGGGLFGANPKTGSIGVVTINMARIGYLAKDEDKFFEILDKLMVLAKQSLEIKRELIENLTYSGLHPYSKFYLSDIKKAFGEYWKNHFSTIGLIGMNDALLNFMNKSIGDKEGQQFALKVLDYMRDRLGDFQQETGNIFNLEATPAEGTSYRLARIDKAKYPDIRIYNQEKYNNNGNRVEPYYTNSTQLPVGYTDDVFEALDLQDPLQAKYTGGTVLHIFLGEESPSPSATKQLIRKVAENYTLPYYTITPTFSVCPIHGYIPGKHEYCPKCDEEIGYKGGG